MKRNYLVSLLGLISMLTLSSCGTTSLYSWYGYDQRIHEFTKKRTPESEEKLIETYKKLIGKPNGTRKSVQPGICAEYGYLLLKLDKKEEGVAMLKKEIELYPESKVFITRIIKQLEK